MCTVPFAPVDMAQFQPALPDKILVNSILPNSSSFKTFRVLVSEELEPIETLQGAEFLKAFFQIERCHYEMWNVKIHHNDLSLANLMYQLNGEQKVGVLSDWDLPATTDERGKGMLERIGTVPYKAFLLIDSSQPENIPHVYRHDLEAFIWILAWAVTRHAEDEIRREMVFSRRTWLTGDRSKVSKRKSWFLMHLDQILPPPSRAEEWILVRALLYDLILTRIQPQSYANKEDEEVSEKDPKETARLHWEVIEKSRLARPLKEVVFASKPQF